MVSMLLAGLDKDGHLSLFAASEAPTVVPASSLLMPACFRPACGFCCLSSLLFPLPSLVMLAEFAAHCLHWLCLPCQICKGS